MKEHWVLLGYAGVDSGTLMVVDPCYVLPDEDGKGADKTYDQAFGNIEKFFASKPPHVESVVKGTGGNATIFGGFGGDGNYPVFGLWQDDYGLKRVVIDVDFSLAEKLGYDL